MHCRLYKNIHCHFMDSSVYQITYNLFKLIFIMLSVSFPVLMSLIKKHTYEKLFPEREKTISVDQWLIYRQIFCAISGKLNWMKTSSKNFLFVQQSKLTFRSEGIMRLVFLTLSNKVQKCLCIRFVWLPLCLSVCTSGCLSVRISVCVCTL